jgi:preprotein translocase subunit SecG
MFIAMVVLHTLLCLAIVGIVLLQSGKGADIGSAFGGAGSQAVFGSMGTPTVLGKITSAVAVLFLVTSFALALLGSAKTSSVIRDVPGAPPAPAPPAASAPAAPPAPPAAAPPAPAAPAK